MIVIGLGYRMRSGKDAVADVLVRQYGFVRRGFADALKDEVLKRLPRTLDAINGWPLAEAGRWRLVYVNKPPAVRALLQEFGTEVRRADDPRYWVKQLAGWVEDRRPERLVVPDVRFRNEVEFVRFLGGVYVRIDRPGTRDGEHASESEISEIAPDYIVQNDGSLEDLCRQVRARFSWLEGK